MVFYRLTMSLSVPAAGSGSTARPPGTNEGSPNVKGRPMGKEQECAPPMGNSTLKTWYGAPATNDRCADNDARVFCEYLLKRMEEEANCKVSPEPWDWQRIHGEDFKEWQEPLAPVHTKDRNYNDHQDDNFWYDTESDLSDEEDYFTSSFTTKSLQLVAEGHNNKSTTAHHAGADTLPHGKGTGISRRRQYLEIKGDFVRCLMGTGTFGWPTLATRPSLRKTNENNREENRADSTPGGSINLMVDCQADSMELVSSESLPDETHIVHKESDKNCVRCERSKADCCCCQGTRRQRRSLQQVRSMLAQTDGDTEVSHSQGWRKWKQERSKPTLTGSDKVAPNTNTRGTTTTTKINDMKGKTPLKITGESQTTKKVQSLSGSPMISPHQSIHTTTIKEKETKQHITQAQQRRRERPMGGMSESGEESRTSRTPESHKSQVLDLINEGLIVIKRPSSQRKGIKTKNSPSPRAKQWRRCGCGRLYRMKTGFCACTASQAPQMKSKTQATKTRARETMTHRQSMQSTETQVRVTHLSPPALPQMPLRVDMPQAKQQSLPIERRKKRDDASSTLQLFIEIEELDGPTLPRGHSQNSGSLSTLKAMTETSSPEGKKMGLELISALRQTSKTTSKWVRTTCGRLRRLMTPQGSTEQATVLNATRCVRAFLPSTQQADPTVDKTQASAKQGNCINTITALNHDRSARLLQPTGLVLTKQAVMGALVIELKEMRMVRFAGLCVSWTRPTTRDLDTYVTRGILPFGISRYKGPGFVVSVSGEKRDVETNTGTDND